MQKSVRSQLCYRIIRMSDESEKTYRFSFFTLVYCKLCLTPGAKNGV